MRISDWSSDVCSSDLVTQGADSRSCERFTGIETRFRADRLRCCRIVTRDHDHTDPGSPALGNRLFDTRAKRILQSNKSKQLKIMLEMILRRHLARDASGRHAKDTHAAHRHRGGRRLEPGLTLLVEPAQAANRLRSEEHTSELQSIMRHPYAVFCL